MRTGCTFSHMDFQQSLLLTDDGHPERTSSSSPITFLKQNYGHIFFLLDIFFLIFPFPPLFNQLTCAFSKSLHIFVVKYAALTE